MAHGQGDEEAGATLDALRREAEGLREKASPSASRLTLTLSPSASRLTLTLTLTPNPNPSPNPSPSPSPNQAIFKLRALAANGDARATAMLEQIEAEGKAEQGTLC